MYQDVNWLAEYTDTGYNLHPTIFVIDKNTGQLIPRDVGHNKYKPKFYK